MNGGRDDTDLPARRVLGLVWYPGPCGASGLEPGLELELEPDWYPGPCGASGPGLELEPELELKPEPELEAEVEEGGGGEGEGEDEEEEEEEEEEGEGQAQAVVGCGQVMKAWIAAKVSSCREIKSSKRTNSTGRPPCAAGVAAKVTQ